MEIANIELTSIQWPKGASARIWFCQPQVELTSPAPFVPMANVRSLDILRAVLNRDAELGAPAGGAPSIALLPEMSISPADVPTVKALIAASRENTLLICGVGHMTSAQMNTIEANSELCGPAIAEHYANCALIGCGGTDKIYLQPKIVPSKDELDYHWPGRVIRYFVGKSFQFVVVVCSEMLNRAGEKTTISDVLEKLDESGRQLAAVFWLQRNERPRSSEFSQSLGELAHFDRPTVFVSGSRMQCPPRFEHYSVSGAFFKRDTVPKHFKFLTRRFHYVEPVANPVSLSRVVLLRYDVDVNLVETVLGSAIDAEDRTSRSQLFSSALPMNVRDGTLVESLENKHLVEIAFLASETAAATAKSQNANVQALTEALVALGTARFQDFLDLAIVPQPLVKDHRHAAGQQHTGGDCYCVCWKHRECIDFLCDDVDTATPLAYVLLALAKIVSQGLIIDFMPDSNAGANIRVSGLASDFTLCIVYPFDFSADETEIAIRGSDEPRLAEPGYIVLGTSGRADRPKLAAIKQSVANRTAPVNAGSAAVPRLKAVYNEELNDWFANGNLAESLKERFSDN
jgi:hypothetical protein